LSRYAELAYFMPNNIGTMPIFILEPIDPSAQVTKIGLFFQSID